VTDFPDGWIGRNEAFAHDGIQNFHQHPFAVLFGACFTQDMTHHDGVGNNQK
jgi:hypothetical protein